VRREVLPKAAPTANHATEKQDEWAEIATQTRGALQNLAKYSENHNLTLRQIRIMRSGNPPFADHFLLQPVAECHRIVSKLLFHGVTLAYPFQKGGQLSANEEIWRVRKMK
jgi:hypothetical protein